MGPTRPNGTRSSSNTSGCTPIRERPWPAGFRFRAIRWNWPSKLRAVADGLAMGVATVEANEGGGIDTEEDLALANARWRETTPTPAGAH
jgi:hypothetical protein